MKKGAILEEKKDTYSGNITDNSILQEKNLGESHCFMILIVGKKTDEI